MLSISEIRSRHIRTCHHASPRAKSAGSLFCVRAAGCALMKLTTLFFQTTKQAPADAETQSAILLARAGYVSKLGTGIFSYLPLAQRSLNKIKAILCEEMDAIGGQQILMPVVHPCELWKKTGRYDAIGDELVRFQ